VFLAAMLRGQGIISLICNGKIRFIAGEKWHVPVIYTNPVKQKLIGI
jgi:hypothetical protein